jgi:hypothetical protein
VEREQPFLVTRDSACMHAWKRAHRLFEVGMVGTDMSCLRAACVLAMSGRGVKGPGGGVV